MTFATDARTADSGPGFLAFVAFFALAIALWFLMRNMNSRLSFMGARSDESAIQAARVRGLAAGNRRHRPGSPVFRHRSIIHSHLSARSMRPSSLMPSRIESGAIRRGVSARRVSYAAGGFSRLRAPSVRVPRRSSLSRRA